MDLSLMDKLKMLNFDTEFRPLAKMRPISRYFFVVPANQGEQFFVFVSLASWLIRKSGKEFEQPQEDDDPNSTITSILEVLRNCGVEADFVQNKLKQGVGEEVIFVLEKLSDLALKAVNSKWKKPFAKQSQESEQALDEIDQIEDESEVLLDRVEEEFDALSDDSEAEDEKEKYDSGKFHSASTYDPEAWRLELERAAPALRIRLTADGRDWRTRLSQMQTYRNDLAERKKTTGNQLTRLHGQLSSALEKVRARETILNGQFDGLVKEFADLQNTLNAVRMEYKTVSGGVTERQEQLSDINDKVEIIKQRTESKGMSINDNSPLVNAKKAIVNLKKEIQAMDIQLHILLWCLTNRSSSLHTGEFANNRLTIEY